MMEPIFPPAAMSGIADEGVAGERHRQAAWEVR